MERLTEISGDEIIPIQDKKVGYKVCMRKLRALEDLEEQIGMPLEDFFKKVGKTREFKVTVSGKRFYDATLLGGEFREDGSFVYCVLVHDAQEVPFHDYFAKIYTHEEAEKKLEEMKNESIPM